MPKPLLAQLTAHDAAHLNRRHPRAKVRPFILTNPQRVWSTQRKIDSLNAALVGMGR